MTEPLRLRIGVVSDTHSLLRPEALAFLQGCDHIIHAGDICGPEVLQELSRIAPVTAVRGNNDGGAWADSLHEFELIQLGELHAYVLHDLATLDLDPKAAGVNAVIFGHSHQPLIEDRDGVLYMNPGSAGPRRFRLPVSIGELIVEGSVIRPRVQELEVRP